MEEGTEVSSVAARKAFFFFLRRMFGWRLMLETPKYPPVSEEPNQPNCYHSHCKKRILMYLSASLKHSTELAHCPYAKIIIKKNNDKCTFFFF